MMPDKDPGTVREGKIVAVFQNADDPEKFSYTVRWDDGVVAPLREDAVVVAPFFDGVTFKLNGLIEDLRAIYSTGAPTDNISIDALFRHFDATSRAFKQYLEVYEQLKWLQDLRNDLLGL